MGVERGPDSLEIYPYSTTLEPSQIAAMFRFVFFAPYPVETVARYLQIESKRIHNFLRTKHGQDFFIAFHPEDCFGEARELWVRANFVNLIVSNANVKPVSCERARSIERVMAVKEFGHFDKSLKHYVYTNDVYRRNQTDFYNYQDRISEKALVFGPDPGKAPDYSIPLLTLPYSTRFNDKVRQWQCRQKYEELWAFAGLRY